MHNVDIDHNLDKGWRRFGRQIVIDAAWNESMHVLAREFLA